MTYKILKLNSINTLTVEIDETFMNNYSIVAYDEENGVFIEKFANSYDSATIQADKLISKITKQY